MTLGLNEMERWVIPMEGGRMSAVRRACAATAAASREDPHPQPASSVSARCVAIDDVSIDIAEGTFFVIVGPSGCGKTTLLRILGGLEQVTSGDGRDHRSGAAAGRNIRWCSRAIRSFRG